MQMTKYERAAALARRAKAKMEEGAKIGTHAAVSGFGGLVAGAVQAKMPLIPNTTLQTNAALAVAGLVGAVTGMFGAYSDHVGSAASGVLAYTLGKESESYFS